MIVGGVVNVVQVRHASESSLIPMGTGLMVFALLVVALIAAPWFILASAARRGRRWSRGLGTAALMLYSVGIVVALVEKRPGQGWSAGCWIAGLVATILLWRESSNGYFYECDNDKLRRSAAGEPSDSWADDVIKNRPEGF